MCLYLLFVIVFSALVAMRGEVLVSSDIRSVSDKWDYKRAQIKAEKLARTLAKSESKSTSTPPIHFKPEGWSAVHQTSSNAIFTVAMSTKYTDTNVHLFCGTARKVGFIGDIVVGILPGSEATFIDALVLTKATVYTLDLKCVGDEGSEQCALEGMTSSYPMGVLRYHIYEWWAALYDTHSWIIMADFRDVFFQADPFLYRTHEWNRYQLVTFMENHPNKVISRSPEDYKLIKGCYGAKAADSISSNTVISSGVTLGTRDAIIGYTYLLLQELNPRQRYDKHISTTSFNSVKANKGCIANSMEHGLHNWLVYSGKLNKYMDVKVFQQGEGPVNNVGSFYNDNVTLKAPNFRVWGIVRGPPNRCYVANWNGDHSPVVHQFYRTSSTTENTTSQAMYSITSHSASIGNRTVLNGREALEIMNIL